MFLRREFIIHRSTVGTVTGRAKVVWAQKMFSRLGETVKCLHLQYICIVQRGRWDCYDEDLRFALQKYTDGRDANDEVEL